MGRLLRWIWNVVSIGSGGGVVPGRPGPVLPPSDASAPRWVTRIAVLTPLVVLVLIVIGLASPIVAVVAAILLLPLVISRIQALRRR